MDRGHRHFEIVSSASDMVGLAWLHGNHARPLSLRSDDKVGLEFPSIGSAADVLDRDGRVTSVKLEALAFGDWLIAALTGIPFPTCGSVGSPSNPYSQGAHRQDECLLRKGAPDKDVGALHPEPTGVQACSCSQPSSEAPSYLGSAVPAPSVIP